jgi:hypothetical protein
MASEFGLSYKGASTDARVKSSFDKAPRKKATKQSAPSEPPKTAKERRTMAASRAMELIHKRRPDGDESWHDYASRYIQDSVGSRFMKEKKPRQPMSEETKAMLKERRAAKKSASAPPPRTTTLKERRQNASKRAMELTQNKPVDYVPKERKPMSEETKAMLKARREAKKSDVSKKFESFWERHGMGTTATTTQAVVEAIAGTSKQPQKSGKGKIVVYLSDGTGLTAKEASEKAFETGAISRISKLTGKPNKPYTGNKVYIIEDWYPGTTYELSASLYKKGITKGQFAAARQSEDAMRELYRSKGIKMFKGKKLG